MQAKRPAPNMATADENRHGTEDQVLASAKQIEDTMEEDVNDWAQKDIEADIVRFNIFLFNKNDLKLCTGARRRRS